MYQPLENLVTKNFDFKFNASVYTSINTALKAYTLFINDHYDFFNFDNKSVLYGHLRSFVVEKHLYINAFTPNSCYSVYHKPVNNFGYKPLFIETDDFVLSVGKTIKPRFLLSKASYKVKLAQNNSPYGQQLKYDYFSDDVKIIENKKYALLTYGYNMGILTHLSIVLPDSTYKNCMYDPINILKYVSLYDNYIPKEIEEDNIVKLKKSLEKEYHKILYKTGD